MSLNKAAIDQDTIHPKHHNIVSALLCLHKTVKESLGNTPAIEDAALICVWRKHTSLYVGS